MLEYFYTSSTTLEEMPPPFLSEEFDVVGRPWYKDGKGRSCAPSAKLGAPGCWEFYENPSDMNDIVRELQSVRAFESFESVNPSIRTH